MWVMISSFDIKFGFLLGQEIENEKKLNPATTQKQAFNELLRGSATAKRNRSPLQFVTIPMSINIFTFQTRWICWVVGTARKLEGHYQGTSWALCLGFHDNGHANTDISEIDPQIGGKSPIFKKNCRWRVIV